MNTKETDQRYKEPPNNCQRGRKWGMGKIKNEKKKKKSNTNGKKKSNTNGKKKEKHIKKSIKIKRGRFRGGGEGKYLKNFFLEAQTIKEKI